MCASSKSLKLQTNPPQKDFNDIMRAGHFFGMPFLFVDITILYFVFNQCYQIEIMIGMNREEKKSLLLIIASIIAMIITILLKRGTAAVCALSISLCLFLWSFRPSFPRKKATDTKISDNRVALAAVYFFITVFFVGFVAGLIYEYVEEGFSGDLLFGLLYIAFIVQAIVFSIFSSRSWFSRRITWLTGNAKLPIEKSGKRKDKQYIAVNPQTETVYIYKPSEKRFYFHRRMYMNPIRYKKEYEERKYQYIVRLQRADIPSEAGLSECEDPFSFLISIRVNKRDATKKNMCQLNDIITELAKDDFDQHLFIRFCQNEFTMYLETYRYRILRMIDVPCEGDVETYSRELTTLPPAIEKDLDIINQHKLLDKLAPEDLIEQSYFEQLWEQ